MKGVFGFLFWATVAVALAMLMGDNPASVTLFWPPYRVDVSFNVALLGLIGLFLLLHLAWRGLALLRQLPKKAQRWRTLQRERAINVAVLDAVAYHMSGRFVRAQGAAQQALQLLQGQEAGAFVHGEQVAVLARVLAAESAHALGNTALRDEYLLAAVEGAEAQHATAAREGALLRATDWALQARDPVQASRWLRDLPQGALRRIQTLKLRLQLARLQKDTVMALDTVRLLAKHRAFAPEIAQSLRRAVVLDALRDVHDGDQLLRVWRGLDAKERAAPELAQALLARWVALQVDAPSADVMAAVGTDNLRVLETCLQTVWDAYLTLSPEHRQRFLLHIEKALPLLSEHWLAQIESRQQQHPAEPGLQYLAGQACLQRQLWGKAAVLLEQASRSLSSGELLRRTWASLARLAEQRGDLSAAQAAWKKAAQI